MACRLSNTHWRRRTARNARALLVTSAFKSLHAASLYLTAWVLAASQVLCVFFDFQTLAALEPAFGCSNRSK
jgi:hypothetical protein